MSEPYVPETGDVIWLSFTPQTGREQAGRRPAVVISPAAYNAKTGLLVCVPITNQAKGYPFEVQVSGENLTGVALADQVKNLDWRSRQAQYQGQISSLQLAEIKAKISVLLALP